MKKYSFTTTSISDWYDSALDSFKTLGSVPELIKTGKEKGDNIIAWKTFKNNKGYIIVEPNNLLDKKLFLTIKENRNTLISIKSKLHQLQQIDTVSNELIHLNRIEQDIISLWNKLDESSKSSFYNKKLIHILTSQVQVIKKPEDQFSALEWATIFYYASETKLLPVNKTKIKAIEQFKNDHTIETTVKNLKSKYYQAKNQINKTSDYPINKLQKIIPFLKANYKQTVTKVENDIIYLKSEHSDY